MGQRVFRGLDRTNTSTQFAIARLQRNETWRTCSEHAFSQHDWIEDHARQRECLNCPTSETRQVFNLSSNARSGQLRHEIPDTEWRLVTHHFTPQRQF